MPAASVVCVLIRSFNVFRYRNPPFYITNCFHVSDTMTFEETCICICECLVGFFWLSVAFRFWCLISIIGQEEAVKLFKQCAFQKDFKKCATQITFYLFYFLFFCYYFSILFLPPNHLSLFLLTKKTLQCGHAHMSRDPFWILLYLWNC